MSISTRYIIPMDDERVYTAGGDDAVTRQMLNRKHVPHHTGLVGVTRSMGEGKKAASQSVTWIALYEQNRTAVKF